MDQKMAKMKALASQMLELCNGNDEVGQLDPTEADADDNDDAGMAVKNMKMKMIAQKSGY